uniref:Major facilitator superfamily (MFS) profile domain-containing protein n=1 Tax=Clytia hemisphaerica TaxID=252671 RepID=A0A7M5VAN5_9CNID
MVGVLFGSASFGQLGDLIGRKYCLQISQLLQIIALLIQGLSYNWYMFICSSFLLGLGAGGFLVVTNIYMLEFIGTKWRTLCATFPAWGMGVILFGALIKALPNWRHMCYLAAALNVPMVCISLFTPRSPRWLFTNGKAEQGKEALVKLAKQNKNETPDFVLLEKLIDEETRKEKQSGSYTYMSLFKFSSTRKKTLLLSYVWFCCGFSYYGLTLGIGTLSGDMAINYMFMGIGELLITLVVIGSAKLSVGYGFVSVIARIGGIVAPQNKILFNQSQHLPFTINGVLILISSLVILMLPETMNSPMADYIGENEEGEACNEESNKRSNQVIPFN